MGFGKRLRRSLRLVLLLQVGVPVLLLLATVLALSLSLFGQLTEERMQRELRQVARVIRLPITQALESGDQTRLDSSLESLFEIDEVYGAYLFDAGGKRLVSHGSVRPTREQATQAIQQTLDGEFDQYEKIRGRNVYSFFMPLFDETGQPSGLLQVTRRRSDIEQELGRLQLYSWLGFGLVSLLVTLVLIFAHSRAIGRPLSRLLQSMRQVESGEQSHRARQQGPAEICQLASGMNRMLDSIQAAERQAEQQRREQAVMAEQLRQSQTLAALGQLSAGVAHELGAPLSVIDGRAVRLLRREADTDRRQELDDIRRQVERMSSIIEQLLTYGRTSRTRRRPMEVALLIQSCVGQAREQGYSTEVDSGPELKICTDPLSTEQLLLNLLRNAWQACPEGPVRIGWRENDQGQVVIRVDDAGPGIPPRQRDQVQEPFVTTKPPGEGSGLGLAIVARIMREHGGEMVIGDSPLGGAGIELIFPAADEEANA